MIVPVQPKLVAPAVLRAADVSSSTAGNMDWRGGPPAPEDDRAPSIHIDRLVVESGMPVSTTAIREGFRDAWLRDDHAPRRWTSDTFRGGLTIDLPPGVTGRELGRRLAQAILQRARVR